MTRIGSLFSGYGGLEQGVQSVLGGSVAWHSEIDPGACKILAHRYPDVPNLGDITTVDWAAVEPVDVLTGGSPCQDLSAAGKRLGMTEGTRSNLWVAMREAIAQLRPLLVVWENVRGALSAPASSDLELREGRLGDGDDGPVLRALGRVLGDLADLGYDASWQGLRAADVGAPHGRFRVFVAAWPAADADDDLGRPAEGPGGPRAEVAAAAGGRRDAAAHPEGHGRHEGRPEPARLIGGSDAALGGAPVSDPTSDQGRLSHGDGQPAADTDGDGLEGVGELVSVGRDADGRGGADIAWGDYEPAIRRWEGVLGRPAPAPTELSAKGSQRLSPRFVEWLMGLPAGWVTDVPGLSRNDQLKALGNGVVSQQCAAALRILLPDAGIHVGPAAPSVAVETLLPTPTAQLQHDSQTHRSGKRSSELLLGGIAKQLADGAA